MSMKERYLYSLIQKRIMRKTENSEELHSIYAKKYANWVVPFFKRHDVIDIPMLVCINTLQRLPEYYIIGNDSVFICDYYLYAYLYDINYILEKSDNNDYMINLWLKVYIEYLFISRNYELCYWFCLTSPDIETFKTTDDYKEQLLMEKLVDYTDTQEELLFLHEAAHYLFEINKDEIKNGKMYQNIERLFDEFVSGHKNSKFISELLADPKFSKDDILEECYCDAESINYVVFKEKIERDIDSMEKYALIFNTIFSVYFLHYLMVEKNDSAEIFNDYHMKLLAYRCGNAYYILHSELSEQKREGEILYLNLAYKKAKEEYVVTGKRIRQLFDILENKLERGSLPYTEDSYEYIKEFLLLQ